MSSLAHPTSDLIDTLRIHIAPVGFEVDRIVMPAIKKKADRVWLITHNGQHEDKGNPFVESIEKKLKAENIQCRQAPADRIDLFDILRALRSIILQEKGNYILVVRPHICSYHDFNRTSKKDNFNVVLIVSTMLII